MSHPSRSSGTPSSGGAGAQLRACVVLSFGPRNTTRGLLKSLRRSCDRLGVDVHEVDAFDPATGRPGHCQDRLVAVLASCDRGPVLLVHDDVAIDDVSLSRLVQAHLDGAAVAIPFTNDTGTDHFHGSLPPAGVARSELRRLANGSDVGTSAAGAVRPSCLVADRDTLRALVTERIHDPFVVVRDRGIGFVRVQGAFAAHDGACAHQIRAAGLSPDAPVLVASMIVKNEEAMLPDCLASLERVVDRIEIVDTGSTDRTVAIAEAAGANVSHVEWCDDFAFARNVAAERCRDAVFTLWIDADERVATTDVALLRDVMAAYRDEVDAFDITIANRNDGLENEPASTFRARRIVRSALLEFAGRIHELPVRRGAPQDPLTARTLDLMSIDHLGYQDDVVDRQDKKERNLRLARAQHGDDTSIKASLDLARSLMLAGDNSVEAIELLRDAVAAAENTRPEWSAYLLGSLSHLLMDAGEIEEAADLSRRGYLTLATDDLAAAVHARTSLMLRREQQLVDDVASMDLSDLADPVFRSPANEHIADVAVVTARARLGDVEGSWSTILAWDGAATPFDSDTWVAVAEVASRCFDGIELLDAVLPLVAEHGDATGLVPAAARVIAPELTALLAVGVLAAGNLIPDAVSTGLVAAMVSKQWPIFDELVPFATALDHVVKQRLALSLDERGEHRRAEAVLGQRSGRALVAGFGGRRD